jgi:23S rRNA (cytosine1962-C5)-methyltransferase
MNNNSAYDKIVLRKNCERRIRGGHKWIFSNEIASPVVSQLKPGEIYELLNHGEEFVGMVYANPSSLIAARFLSPKKIEIDRDFIKDRILRAKLYRERIFQQRDHYRVVFGEGDLMPGLIVDKFGSVLVVQILTAGMEHLKNLVVDVLVELFEPECIYMRNDSSVRSLEGLTLEKYVAFGEIPEKVIIRSGNLNFYIDIVDGQKTGFFLDQESNRDLIPKYIQPGDRVLDLYTYSGGWGLQAVSAGASSTVLVDSSQPALDLASRNAELNGLANDISFTKATALDFLKQNHETWGMIILDPPAFIKNKAQIKTGIKGYIDVNRRALGKLQPGGILVTCSCSYHLNQQDFESVLLAAGRQSGKEMRIVEMRGQGSDHPFLLAMPETRYLKIAVAQVM